MKHLIKMGILAATLFTMVLAPLSQAAAAGYGSYQGGGYYGSGYSGDGYHYAQHKKGYKRDRGYERERGYKRDRGYKHRPHRCETKRYRWSKSCRHYHRQYRHNRDWRR